MPPKKHTRTESDANQASASSDKRQKPKEEGSETAREGSGDLPVCAEKERDLFGWYCIARPRFDFENEVNNGGGGDGDGPAADEEEDEDADEDEDEEDKAERLYLAQRGKKILGEPVAEHPEHRWFAFWQTWKLFVGWHDAAQWCDPDSFGMYICSGFNGYGLQEVIERVIANALNAHQLVAFNDQFKKKDRNEETINHMWAVVAAMVHWLTTKELGPWLSCEDGERIGETIKGIGDMLLTMLNELDRAGELKADSRLKDLPLVMAWYLEWSKDLDGMGFDDDQLDWCPHVVAYAKKGGIDLATSGLFGAGDRVAALEQEEGGEIPALEGQTKADRWGWKTSFAAMKMKGGTAFGARNYDITQWTRAKRAKHAFNKRDPLAGIPEKEIKAGNIGLA
ncbi:hypothetical protein PG996_002611 [Apiospora saccharicola]|uniref:Uncharacterized protein n=1 Tax=Apiospora saccharicola TaxID=335842 RepID=A0ABR1WJY0_9PEZI